MPAKVDLYKIFIASPSDLKEERDAIPELINEWNAIYGAQFGIFFLPVKWETQSAPMMGERPQAIINEQLLDQCDLLVALFWTRIGHHTGEEVGGTVEEIKRFVSDKKPALLYFSERAIPPTKIDTVQLDQLNKFRSEMESQGLIDTFSELHDFRTKFSRQLTITIGRILANTGTRVISKSVKESIKEVSQFNLTNEEIRNWLYKTFNAIKRDDNSADLASFSSYLNRYTPVDYHQSGFQKMKNFLESFDMFDFHILDNAATHQRISLKPS